MTLWLCSARVPAGPLGKSGTCGCSAGSASYLPPVCEFGHGPMLEVRPSNDIPPPVTKGQR